MKFKYLFFTLVTSISCWATTPTVQSPEQIDNLIKSTQEFSYSLYHQLDQNENLVFSPYSIFSCLSMVYVGARDETATEIQRCLKLKNTQSKIPSLFFELNKRISKKGEEGYDLSLANGLWVNKDSFVLSDFRHTLQDDFDAQVSELDFSHNEEAIQVINEWTSNTTKGKIPELLEPSDVNKLTRVVLTNALYFAGKWVSPFSPDQTKEGNFYPTPKTPTIAHLMEQTHTFPYFENDLVQMVALPFEGNTFKNSELACLILLPQEDLSLTDLQDKITQGALPFWLNTLTPTYLKVSVPRFELTRRYDLNTALQTLGIKTAFTDKANFSGIDGMRDLFLQKVVHATYFSFNESGVTAAAATGASMGLTSFPEDKPKPFLANRPFLFLIIELESGLPLFMGKLIQPK